MYNYHILFEIRDFIRNFLNKPLENAIIIRGTVKEEKMHYQNQEKSFDYSFQLKNIRKEEILPVIKNVNNPEDVLALLEVTKKGDKEVFNSFTLLDPQYFYDNNKKLDEFARYLEISHSNGKFNLLPEDIDKIRYLAINPLHITSSLLFFDFITKVTHDFETKSYTCIREEIKIFNEKDIEDFMKKLLTNKYSGNEYSGRNGTIQLFTNIEKNFTSIKPIIEEIFN